MFASTIRLDLGITVGPNKPGHIKSILSDSLPIFLDYPDTCGWQEFGGITSSALWRMRSVLKHHPGRVRGIAFGGELPSFKKFYKMTSCAFPMLESLSLHFYHNDPDIPATFLRAPDLPYLHHLRRLSVTCVPFNAIFDFLSSATALTDLTLLIESPFGLTPETSLIACLQAMPCLVSLDLTLLGRPVDSDSYALSESSAPEDTVIYQSPEEVFTHPKLKYLRFTGDDRAILAFTRWLRVPGSSQEYIKTDFSGAGPYSGFPLSPIPRFFAPICDRWRGTYLSGMSLPVPVNYYEEVSWSRFTSPS